MSAYSFIAADYELPELDNTKKRFITPAEAMELGLAAPSYKPWEEFAPEEKILVFEREEDMYELAINKACYADLETLMRTCLPYIYAVDFLYTDSRAQELVEYIKKNAKAGGELELWEIWLDDAAPAKPVDCDIGALTTEHIKTLYDRSYEKHVYPGCLRIHA